MATHLKCFDSILVRLDIETEYIPEKHPERHSLCFDSILVRLDIETF